jgi:hypothetical protein
MRTNVAGFHPQQSNDIRDAQKTQKEAIERAMRQQEEAIKKIQDDAKRRGGQ